MCLDFGMAYENERQWYINEHEIDVNEIPTDQLEDCDYKCLRVIVDMFDAQETKIKELEEKIGKMEFLGGITDQVVAKSATETFVKENKELEEKVDELAKEGMCLLRTC